jgi:hypothetical protein
VTHHTGQLLYYLYSSLLVRRAVQQFLGSTDGTPTVKPSWPLPTRATVCHLLLAFTLRDL